MSLRFGGIGVRQKWERWVWQSPRRALTPRIEAAADRMGRVDRMKASPRRRVKMARSIALGAQAHSGIGVNGADLSI